MKNRRFCSPRRGCFWAGHGLDTPSDGLKCPTRAAHFTDKKQKKAVDVYRNTVYDHSVAENCCTRVNRGVNMNKYLTTLGLGVMIGAVSVFAAPTWDVANNRVTYSVFQDNFQLGVDGGGE